MNLARTTITVLALFVIVGLSDRCAQAEFEGYTAEIVQARKLPTQADPPWFVKALIRSRFSPFTDICVFRDDYVRIGHDQTGISYGYAWDVDCRRGYAVKWSCRYVSGKSHQVEIYDGQYRASIQYAPAGLVFTNNGSIEVKADTTQFHDYMFVRRDRNVRFFIDGKQVLEKRFDSVHNLRGIVFGGSANSGTPGYMDFKYCVFDREPDVSMLPPADPPRQAFPRSRAQAQKLSEKSIRLENNNIAVLLDRTTAGITAIENKLASETYFVDDPGFAVEVGTGADPGTLGILTPQACSLIKLNHNETKVVYSFVKEPVTVEVAYQLDRADEFATKRVRVKYNGQGKFNINRLEMFDWDISPRPVRAIPYYGYTPPGAWAHIADGQDVPPCANSTAFYYRMTKGGVFTAISCDFVLLKDDVNTARYESTYWPGFILSADDTYESEQGIIGVYRRKGYWHKSIQSGLAVTYARHPDVDTVMDRAENEAMTNVVHKLIAPGVCYPWVNAWAVGAPALIENQQHLDRFKAGIDATKKIGPIEGYLIPNWNGLACEFQDQGLDMPKTPNPHMLKLFEYMTEKDMGAFGWIGISNNYPVTFVKHRKDRPVTGSKELLVMKPKGQRVESNIAISKKYMDFTYDMVCHFKKSFPKMEAWGYDFLSIASDYDTEHGYLPGRSSLHPQWYNVRDLDRRLRKRFPNLMIGGWLGWQYLGPFLAETMSICHNGIDHHSFSMRNFLDFHIDHQFANNVRLTDWFANNCKFYPRYIMDSVVTHNGHDMRAWDYGAWKYSILSQLAASQNFGYLANLPVGEAGEKLSNDDVAFLSKWMTWHQAHYDYYRRERELFGEPRLTGVDGYAYGNGTDSIVFLCNPTYRTHEVAVPINDDIHLPGGKDYTVKELYPEERYRVGLKDGVFEHGSLFVVSVPPQTVMVLEVKPDDPNKVLLMGVAGDIRPAPEGFTIENMSGPTGQSRLVALRVPKAYQDNGKGHADGKVVLTQRQGQLLLGRVRFEGESVQPEVADYQVTKAGERLLITAKIHVPSVVEKILTSQKLPFPAKYNTDHWLNRTAWLGWNRFIIYLPIDPPVAADSHYTASASIEANFEIKARLNGQTIVIHSNDMGKGKMGRWAGFFIDASEGIAYGKVNKLELDMPYISEDRFYGIYLPNLTRQQTTQFAVEPPPPGLVITETPDASGAFYPVPVVSKQDDKRTVYLKLALKAQQPVVMDLSEINITGGNATGTVVAGADARWLTDAETTNAGHILVSGKSKSVTMQVAGTDATVIQLGSGKEKCQFTLGEVLEQWEKRGDPFDPHVTELPWPAKQAIVTIELVGPTAKKRAVSENL